MLEILKVAVVATLEFPIKVKKPVQAKIDVKFVSTCCNLLTSSLNCWVKFMLRILKKLAPEADEHGESIAVHGAPKPMRTWVNNWSWVCTLAAPDLTIIALSLDGLSIYHVELPSPTSPLIEGLQSDILLFTSLSKGRCV